LETKTKAIIYNTNYATQHHNMILTFSPEQAYEVSRAFDASWLMNAALAAEAAASQAATVACNNKTKSTDAADNADDKAASEEPTSATAAKKGACHANKKKGSACCQNKNNKKTVQPCQRYNQNAQARCNRRCANAQRQQQKEATAPPPPTRIVVQRTPIHMDDSQPEFAKMSLDVTGFAPHQIKVSVDDYMVSISGERRNKLGDLFVIDRKFRLDKKTALVDGVEASFDNDDVAGILEIVVPKNVSAGPRTIPIAVMTSSKSNNNTDEETEVVDDAVEETTTEDDNQSDAATPADHEEEEEEQNHSTEEVATSVETVQEEDADEEEVQDEQQTDATTDDNSGGDVVVTEGLEWEEVASEEKE